MQLNISKTWLFFNAGINVLRWTSCGSKLTSIELVSTRRARIETLLPLENIEFIHQVYELKGPELKLVKEVEKPSSFKCGTFGASSLADRHLATGSFAGKLQVWDVENTREPIYDIQAHASIVNAIDGCGGQVRLIHILVL